MAAFVMLSAVLLGLLLPFSMADNNNILHGDQTLEPGKSLTAGEFTFIMQLDCDLVLYDMDKNVIWSSNTSGKGNDCYAHFQENGNLVINGYDAKGKEGVIWASDTSQRGNGNYILVVQGDGYVTIRGEAIWIKPDTPHPTNMKIRKKIAMVTKN
ncbi:mannose-specific lectin-like [Curcuma longa]|uniref:mannose-specific lectin-like n=1 Tax=Curcuma longa TaxID=136217 RepID=UPI003D9EE0D2